MEYEQANRAKSGPNLERVRQNMIVIATRVSELICVFAWMQENTILIGTGPNCTAKSLATMLSKEQWLMLLLDQEWGWGRT